MAVFVTGDMHNRHDMDKFFSYNFPEGVSLTRKDVVIVCGDFGVPWAFDDADAEVLEYLERMPWTTAFVDGNHDNHPALLQHGIVEWRGGRANRISDNIWHMMRGEAFDFDGELVFTMGGAESSDREYRVEGLSWWPEELPSEDEIAHARDTLAGVDWEVGYIVTHTAPTSVTQAGILGRNAWRHPEVDRLTDFLDEVMAKTKYKRWYCGHFHENADARVRDGELDPRMTVLYRDVLRLGQTHADHLEERYGDQRVWRDWDDCRPDGPWQDGYIDETDWYRTDGELDRIARFWKEDWE